MLRNKTNIRSIDTVAVGMNEADRHRHSSIFLRVILCALLFCLPHNSFLLAESDVFVSLKSSEVNMRVGPGKEYPVSWVFMKAYLPMILIAEFDQWRKVKFLDGTTGWVHKNMISRRCTAITLKDTVMYKNDSKKYPVAKLEKGVIVKVIKQESEFVKIEVSHLKGWVEREVLWGF